MKQNSKIAHLLAIIGCGTVKRGWDAEWSSVVTFVNQGKVRERGRVKRMTTIINNYLTENPRMSSAVVGCLLIKKVHNSST